jgi:hypothetical protein
MPPFSIPARSAARTALLGLVAAVALTGCADRSEGIVSAVATGTASQPSATAASSPKATVSESTPEATAKARPPKTAPVSTRMLSSDVSQLKSLGIAINGGVLIDVADDGLDRYLEIGKAGAIDFTGTGRTDNTMMSLKPAPVRQRTEATRNRVVIAPPFYNEDLGAGSCVADTAAGVLRLAECHAGAADQVWQVIPAGDSGQFELHGANTEIRVNEGRITTGTRGYVGLQTLEFAE